jgi:hypothetical protein
VASRLGERVLDDRIVERTKHERPGHQGWTASHHADLMAEQGMAIRSGHDFEGVEPVESRWTGEAKLHPMTGVVRLDLVAYGPVASGGPDLEGSVEPHRWPIGARPEPIVGAREGVQ